MSSQVDTEKLSGILSTGIESMGLMVTQEQQQKLIAYVALMHKWNKAYNLTSVREPEQMVVKHLLDSLSVMPHISAQNVIDVGTGPGLPGMPLAIVLPETRFTLLDSLGKRVRFMKQCVHELKLENVECVHDRVEAHTEKAPYDIVLSRAFASLKDMLHWCEHLVDSNGKYLALKGQFPQSEIDEVSNHFCVDSVLTLEVPDLVGERHLVTIHKA